MKTLHISIFVTLIITISLISLLPVVFAEESITVSTDKTSYQYGDNYTISGQVNPVVPDQEISILILISNYSHPESLSISPDSDGRYSYTLPLSISDITSTNFTLIAKYAGAMNQTTFSDTGLPCNQQSIPAHVYAPIIRGPPANNPRILDSSGNALIGPVKVGQQIQITYTLANGLNCVQPFAYLVQIQDIDGKTVSLSWITGTLLAGQSLNPAQSWTPQHNGTYTAQIFTWQSIDNPNALAPPVIITIDVEPNLNSTQSSQVVPMISSNCNEGFTQIIKKEDNSPACVKLETAQKLVERGWALDQVLQTSEDVATNSSSSLKLSLSTNSTIIQSGQAIEITISLDNVSPHLLTMHPQNNWPIQGLDLDGCSNSPMGVAILDGFYTMQNMSGRHPMVFHFLYPCPPSLSARSFTFYPMSNNVTIICEPGDWGTCQHLIHTKASVAYHSFLQDGKFFDFNSGNYTIIAGDEWGDVAIRHFQVVNSTQTHMEYDQPIVTQTYDLHGKIKDIMPGMIFGKLASSSTGIAIARGGGLDVYDNDSIKLELNYGNTSDSHVISATVQNLGKKTVHIYDIFISGFIPLANDDHLNFVVVRGDPYVVSKDDAILEPGESITKYIVGNWTVDGKLVNGFSAGASYSYDDLQNFDGMTNGYSISVPVQWVK